MIFASFLVISCQTDDDSTSSDTTGQTIIEATATATDGNWRVQSYIDSGVDETSDFAGYTFIFSADGKITASNGTTTLEGVWSITDSDSSSDDDSEEDLDFNIVFAVSADHDFDDLNDDWDILSISSSKIDLRDVSGGDGSIDLLAFVKI